MDIHIRIIRTVTIIDLSGNLIIGKSEESLRETVNRMLAEDRKDLILNLSEVPIIDSSGIGAMIKCFTSVKAGGGRFKLLGPSRMARQLLNITGLLSVLETFDDETTALASF